MVRAIVITCMIVSGNCAATISKQVRITLNACHTGPVLIQESDGTMRRVTVVCVNNVNNP